MCEESTSATHADRTGDRTDHGAAHRSLACRSSAVLDVYQLVGLEAMKRGYRAMYPLRPPYGGPIPVSSINAFVAEMPEALRAQVAEKLGRVGF